MSPTPQEANCFLLFNVEAALSTSHRKQFLLALCDRFGVDGKLALREFFGDGKSTGAVPTKSVMRLFWNM